MIVPCILFVDNVKVCNEHHNAADLVSHQNILMAL
jgi:hypothetical protein